MRKGYLLIILWIIASSLAWAEPFYPVSAIPAAMKENALAVVRASTRTVKVKSANNAVVTDYRVITILHAEGQHMAMASEAYTSRAPLTGFKVRWYNAEGMLTRQFGRQAFKDRSAVSSTSLFEDTRERYLDEIPSVYPVTIEITTETVLKGYLDLPGFYPYPGWDISVQSASYTIQWADGYKPEFLLVNQMPSPGLVEDNKLAWQVNGLPSKHGELMAPDYYKSFPHVLVSPLTFNYYNHKGNMRTWADYGAWLYNLQECGDSLMPATAAWVDSLVKAEPDRLKRARAIYRYMQHKTRYVSIQEGINGFKPFPAYEVDQLGYGDCKGLVNLTRIMLRRAGIASYTTAVLMGKQRFKGDDFVHAGYFNHVVLAVPMAQDTFWLECTNPYQRFGVLNPLLHEAYGLWIDKASSRPVKLQSADKGISVYRSRTTVHIDTSGNARALISTCITGVYEDNARQHYLYQQPIAIKQWKQDMLNYPQLSITGTPIWQSNQDSGWITESINADITGWVRREKEFTLTPVFPCGLQVPSPRKYIRRLQPFEIPYRLVYEDTVTIKAPGNRRIFSVLASNRIETVFGLFIIKQITVDSREVTVMRRLEIYPGIYNTGNYGGYIEFMESVEAIAQPYLPLLQR